MSSHQFSESFHKSFDITIYSCYPIAMLQVQPIDFVNLHFESLLQPSHVPHFPFRTPSTPPHFGQRFCCICCSVCFCFVRFACMCHFFISFSCVLSLASTVSNFELNVALFPYRSLLFGVARALVSIVSDKPHKHGQNEHLI